MSRKKNVVITGGSKGIGKAAALLFAKDGYAIAICARNEKDLEETANELSKAGAPVVFTQRVDLRNREQVAEFGEAVCNNFENIDLLVNNAGTYAPGSLLDEDDANFDLMLETNLHSTYFMTRAIVPKMVEHGSGHVINICSTASIMPYMNGGSYCISKYAQYGLTKVLREELKEHGIRVTAILPGATRTSSWDGTPLPHNRFIPPESIAKAIHDAWSMPNNVDVEDVVVRPILGDIT